MQPDGRGFGSFITSLNKLVFPAGRGQILGQILGTIYEARSRDH